MQKKLFLLMACLLIGTMTACATEQENSSSGGEESVLNSESPSEGERESTQAPDEESSSESMTEKTTVEPSQEKPTQATVPVKPPASATPKDLLNNEPLNPKKSGYEELDNLTSQILGEITNDSMSNYEKVAACYSWFVTSIAYTGGMHTTPGKFSDSDESTAPKEVLWATDILNARKGNCYNFAAGFMYLCRALGYDAHLVSGTTVNTSGEYTEHCWCYLNLGGKAYSFDADVDMDRYKRGQNMYGYFCRDMNEMLKWTYRATTYYDN